MKRYELSAFTIAALLLAAACSVSSGNGGQSPALSPAASPTSAPSPSAVASPTASPAPRSFAASPSAHAQCPDFTPPPYDSFEPVVGISIRVINKGLFEITNATKKSYYGKVFKWTTESNLVCGQGVLGHDSVLGRIAPGATLRWSAGSTTDVPVTVEIWDRPCGEGCYEGSIGAYLLPVSSIEPVPISS
jgi:hypothetical protein